MLDENDDLMMFIALNCSDRKPRLSFLPLIEVGATFHSYKSNNSHGLFYCTITYTYLYLNAQQS